MQRLNSRSTHSDATEAGLSTTRQAAHSSKAAWIRHLKASPGSIALSYQTGIEAAAKYDAKESTYARSDLL
jgi:hypothetical protein